MQMDMECLGGRKITRTMHFLSWSFFQWSKEEKAVKIQFSNWSSIHAAAPAAAVVCSICCSCSCSCCCCLNILASHRNVFIFITLPLWRIFFFHSKTEKYHHHWSDWMLNKFGMIKIYTYSGEESKIKINKYRKRMIFNTRI